MHFARGAVLDRPVHLLFLTAPGNEPTGLTCRVYRRRDGRISPTPDPADLRDALRAASATATGRS